MKYLKYNIILFLVLFACKNETPNCGCESEISSTIEESEAVSALIYQLTDSQVDYLDDGPVIYIDPASCGGCSYNYAICNPEMLSGLGEIPPYPGIPITFSGFVRDKCEQPDGNPVSFRLDWITLNSIELGN